jgi:L-malate glycosyltransferase
MNILHLHTELNKTCGITKTILLLTKNPGGEFRHFVFTLGGDNVGLFNTNGISTLVLKVNKYSPLSIIKTVKTILKICKKEEIDILHAHHRYFDFLAFIISKIIQVKRITTVQSKVFGYKWFSYKSPYLIAVSNAIKSHLVKNFKIPESRITVINNFVEEVVQVDNYLDEEKILPSDKKIFLFIGRFSSEKGVDILVKAFQKLQSTGISVHLVMIGSGDQEAYLKSFIHENKLSAEVIAPLGNVNVYYKRAFAVVLPSRVDPFPLVMLETGIMSKPFIGSAVDGIAEFIESGKDGLLVSPGDINELFAAMKKILDEPLLADSFGKDLFIKVKQKCSTNVILPNYLELYKRVMSGD